MTLRIAMWSGPRNISTALMRSFGAREDTAVSDEPFYGCFLKQTGADHPMAAEIVQDMDCDWNSVAQTLSGPAPAAAPVWYQKHMAHHMVDASAFSKLRGFTHAFLIRDPVRVIASYAKKRESVTGADLGYEALLGYFMREADRLGHAPPVIDSADVLADPERVLRALCGALGIAWDPAMLHWLPGRRDTDGIWASHWYERVEASTGFERPDEAKVRRETLPQDVLAACQPFYEQLKAHALRS